MVSRYDSFWTVWMASKWLWCIFQLPLISGLRPPPAGRSISPIPPPFRRLPKGHQAGEVALFQQLQRRPATGGEVVDLVGQAEGRHGGRAVAPADHGEGRASATASATARVPAAKRSSSNSPMGPFHNTVRASWTTSANAAALSGPMSSAFHPSSTSTPTWRTSSSGPSATRSCGRRMRSPAASSNERQVSTWSASNSESPMPWPWAARKVKHIPPPMTSESTASSRALMTPACR